MDMIRECLKTESQFGVCLITEGSETGKPAKHEMHGCAASIAQWDMEQLGLLQIRTIGGHRFEIVDHETQADGLIVAQVQFLDHEADAGIPEHFIPCVELLKRIVNDLVAKETTDMHKMIEGQCQFDSASWVSMRLCEFLPLDPNVKHRLMTMNDPTARLLMVHEYLSQQQVI